MKVTLGAGKAWAALTKQEKQAAVKVLNSQDLKKVKKQGVLIAVAV